MIRRPPRSTLFPDTQLFRTLAYCFLFYTHFLRASFLRNGFTKLFISCLDITVCLFTAEGGGGEFCYEEHSAFLSPIQPFHQSFACVSVRLRERATCYSHTNHPDPSCSMVVCVCVRQMRITPVIFSFLCVKVQQYIFSWRRGWGGGGH